MTEQGSSRPLPVHARHGRRPGVRVRVDQPAEAAHHRGIGRTGQAQRAGGRGHVAGGGRGQPPRVRQVAQVVVQEGRVDAGGQQRVRDGGGGGGAARPGGGEQVRRGGEARGAGAAAVQAGGGGGSGGGGRGEGVPQDLVDALQHARPARLRRQDRVGEADLSHKSWSWDMQCVAGDRKMFNCNRDS